MGIEVGTIACDLGYPRGAASEVCSSLRLLECRGVCFWESRGEICTPGHEQPKLIKKPNQNNNNKTKCKQTNKTQDPLDLRISHANSSLERHLLASQECQEQNLGKDRMLKRCSRKQKAVLWTLNLCQLYNSLWSLFLLGSLLLTSLLISISKSCKRGWGGYILLLDYTELLGAAWRWSDPEDRPPGSPVESTQGLCCYPLEKVFPASRLLEGRDPART